MAVADYYTPLAAKHCAKNSSDLRCLYNSFNKQTNYGTEKRRKGDLTLFFRRWRPRWDEFWTVFFSFVCCLL